VSEPILVTGASGFAGSHLLDSLTADNLPVVAWRRQEGSFNQATVCGEAVDLLDREKVRGAIARLRPSVVYHCAGAAHVGRAWEETEATFATNVLGTHHLIEALRTAGNTARILITSSAMVYATSDEPLHEESPLRPSNPYGLSKLAQELVALHAPAHASVARAFNHVGPRQGPFFAASGFARQIADIETGRIEPVISVGNLEARRDLTDVRDTVRAYRAILERGQSGRTYNVCSGTAVQIGELLDRLVARARVKIRIRIDPSRYRPNDQPLIVGDSRRIREELGWTPIIPLNQTIDDLLDYWRTQLSPARA
jgi:GDP-4-dehydro-6-deoxy-D-mannose reductase